MLQSFIDAGWACLPLCPISDLAFNPSLDGIRGMLGDASGLHLLPVARILPKPRQGLYESQTDHSL